MYQNIHQQLINRCKKQSRKAQFEIYKLYYRAMYNSALMIIKNDVDAEDIMQEAFLSAFKNIDSYKGNVSFGAWLKRIVINKSLDYLKQRKVEIFPINENLTQHPQVDIEETDNDLQVEKVKKAIAKLPSGYRIIINLYLIEGYDHEEIASILNISASTSRSQFLRAKKKLITIINDN